MTKKLLIIFIIFTGIMILIKLVFYQPFKSTMIIESVIAGMIYTGIMYLIEKKKIKSVSK